MKKLLLIIIFTVPVIAFAQQPKMNLRLFGGANATTFVYRIEGVEADHVPGWQVGGGFRVMMRKAFVELDIVYLDYGLTYYPNEDSILILEDPLTIRMRALEFPINIGWIPIKTPVFKLFLYGGLDSRFSIRGRYIYQDQKEKFKPSDLDLHTYNLGARFGTQVDIAMFNFDFNYTIGITNAFKGKARTNAHSLQLSMGFVF